jgi:hypothetical protein
MPEVLMGEFRDLVCRRAEAAEEAWSVAKLGGNKGHTESEKREDGSGKGVDAEQVEAEVER